MRRGQGKYGVAPRAERTVDGITFASKAEARRYGELRMMERAKEIDGLLLQPRWWLRALGENGETILVGEYVADFSYWTLASGAWDKIVVEDVKGVRTPLYQLKKKIFEANYGIKITEIGEQNKERRCRTKSAKR